MICFQQNSNSSIVVHTTNMDIHIYTCSITQVPEPNIALAYSELSFSVAAWLNMAWCSLLLLLNLVPPEPHDEKRLN